MKVVIKYLTGILILLAFIPSCEKEITNPFDPDCPKEIWTPKNFQVFQSENKLNLTWEQENMNISGFKIERKVGTRDWTEVASPGKTATSWSDSDLKGREVHQYRLYAYAGGNFSNTVTANYTPNLKANVTALPASNIQVFTATLNGSVNANGSLTTVTFLYKKKSSSDWISVDANTKTVDGKNDVSVYAHISNLSPGEEYIFKIKAVNSSGEILSAEQIFVTLPEASDPINLPIDFESFAVNYEFIDFGNVATSVVDNPSASGINPSAKVAKLVKNTGAETWAGTFLTLENPIDFATDKTFKVKVWSPKIGAVVRMKIENQNDSGINREVDAETNLSNQWEELSFDFSAIDISKEYQKVVIFFDFGYRGDGAIYYFDDIKLVPSASENYPIIYVPGNYQVASGYSDGDWAPGKAPTLASVNSDNIYDGYIWFANNKSEYKFTKGPNWDVDWGDSDGDGSLESGGANIMAQETGMYKINVNLNNNSYTSVKTDWGLVGNVTSEGWDKSIPMNFDPVSKVWWLVADLNSGSFKFRANNNWIINLGDNGADGILDYDGADIALNEPGKYILKLYLGNPDYTYSIKKQSSN
jgi:hypothetical protein